MESRLTAKTYEAVIGLEIHAQLLTVSKMFCGCSTKFGLAPNSATCPVCLGLPGVLPVTNRKAVEYALRVALALNCQVAPHSIFARKNYFYPDLPKAYQISQYELPLAEHGYLDIETEGGIKRIRIHRVHMEEDAGKLLHEAEADSSLVDLNRCGTPLIEIVSEPDISSPAEAKTFMMKLRDILAYLQVCDCNMEEGSLRCDANVSIRPVGEKKLGTKAEVKNMNSFRFMQRAMEYEIERQQIELESGGRVVQETRLWDSAQGITLSMRSKEEAHDYRYFPDPDLVPVEVAENWIETVAKGLPELPDAKKSRFIAQYDLPAYDASVLTTDRSLADYYEACAKLFPQPKTVSNWVMGELLRLLKTDNRDIQDCPVSAKSLANLLELIQQGVISAKIAKEVFEEMYTTGQAAAAIVERKGLKQISGEDAVIQMIDQVLAENPKHVADYKSGKDKLFGYLMGQVMKRSGGKVNPQLAEKLLRQRLSV